MLWKNAPPPPPPRQAPVLGLKTILRW